jgi:tRNA pseudouridine13 synthase
MLWATHDFKLALKSFPRQLRFERLMLESLAEEPCDFVGAFRRLPVKLCGLFVQAYQSYLFNRFLSSRVGRGLSLKVAEVGDYAVSVERSGLPLARMHKTVDLSNIAEINRALDGGRMRLAIPLVGYGQHPSRGVQGEVEREVLDEEGVCEEDFRVGVMPMVSSRGELRAVVSPLREFMFDVVDDDPVSEGRTLNVDFMLYRGAYATVVLRELMKPQRVVEAGF